MAVLLIVQAVSFFKDARNVAGRHKISLSIYFLQEPYQYCSMVGLPKFYNPIYRLPQFELFILIIHDFTGDNARLSIAVAEAHNLWSIMVK